MFLVSSHEYLDRLPAEWNQTSGLEVLLKFFVPTFPDQIARTISGKRLDPRAADSSLLFDSPCS